MKKILLTLALLMTLGMQAKTWKADEVKEIIRRVNTYWQTHNKAEVRAFWDNAAYHTGNMEVYHLLKDEKMLDYSIRWAEHNQWKGAKETDPAKWKYKNYGEGQDYVLFGDWQICFQTYIDLYQIKKDDIRVKRAKEVMGYEADSKVSDYWWWADALYMVMPVMTKMYLLTGDTKYLDKLYQNILYSDSIMLDSETGLYFRDGKYVYPKHKTASGKKDFWARGDGWVLAGLAKVLADMPKTYQHRQFFVKKYQRLARAVADLQQPQGHWTRSMMDPEQAPGYETSGTAFFCYGLLWGVNHGYLSKEEYRPVIEKAWNYLSTVALQNDGKVGYVQPIGERAIPGQTVDANSQANFGVGAFLLAACEYTRYLETKQPRHFFDIGENTFLLDQQPFVVKAAELHYPRIPREYWEHRIQMCKALGMNTICLYVFWNIHEQREGEFDFIGQNDVAAFCRLAQKNGMWVIVRPGPYVCAEWEMGGLPWWLLKKKDIRLREQDPYFMERVKLFEQKVGEQLSSLTIQHGGPIIMIQVENEYGSYGEDKPYVSEIRDCLRGIYGKEMTLFQCDWASNFTKNGLDDLTWTMNFGTGANIDSQFKRLGELRPDAPKMCSEFWSGWFDKWGARHETRPAKEMVAGIDEMLSKGISFSLYMTHGGTSFGHWAGANSPGFAPDVTSYDYDAPINEYGQATPKYYELRNMLQKYSDKKLPAVPKSPAPIITIPKFRLEKMMRISDYQTARRRSHEVLTMEDMDCGWGMIEYTTQLPEVPVKSVLLLNDCHDFAQVYIDGHYIGKIDRVKNEKSITLPPVKKGQTLNILVEAMGRINFGRAIKDFKGITDEVLIKTEMDGHEITWNLKNWSIITMSDDYEAISKEMSQGHDDLKRSETIFSEGGYYRGYFNLKKVGDTFLNFETWGKGQVWVNGHALGRIWSIGPQQTLYVPGCWLKKGRNEVVVLDITGPKDPVVWGQAQPELNKLQLEKSNKHNNIEDKPRLNNVKPVATGAFQPGNGWQTVSFLAPQKGRYIAIECLSTQRPDDVVAIAELYVQDASGKRISRESWTVRYADSENADRNHLGDKVFDLQESTYWSTIKGEKCPHLLVIDLGSEQTISGLEYLPRAEEGAPGSVKDYRIYVINK